MEIIDRTVHNVQQVKLPLLFLSKLLCYLLPFAAIPPPAPSAAEQALVPWEPGAVELGAEQLYFDSKTFLALREPYSKQKKN